MSNSYLKRILTFLNERFPPISSLITAFIYVTGMYGLLSAYQGKKTLEFDSFYFLGAFTFLFLTLIMRISDEFKDKDSDKILFPERCLPAGKVKYSDITKLAYGIMAVMIPVNFIVGNSPLLFIALIIYTFLFYKYFFMPKIISQNLILALLTHNPIVIVASFYILSLFLTKEGLSVFNLDVLLVILVFWPASVIWETARKIIPKEDENEYLTYSKALGSRGAPLLPLIGVLIQGTSFIFLSEKFLYASTIKYLAFFLMAIYAVPFVLFMISPKRSLSNYFLRISEVYITLFNILVLTASFITIYKG